MRKTARPVSILSTVAIAVAGFLSMWLLGYFLPGANPIRTVLTQLLLIALGLGIAYAVLKLVFHKARSNDPEEKELKLKDLPNDAPPRA